MSADPHSSEISPDLPQVSNIYTKNSHMVSCTLPPPPPPPPPPPTNAIQNIQNFVVESKFSRYMWGEVNLD